MHPQIRPEIPQNGVGRGRVAAVATHPGDPPTRWWRPTRATPPPRATHPGDPPRADDPPRRPAPRTPIGKCRACGIQYFCGRPHQQQQHSSVDVRRGHKPQRRGEQRRGIEEMKQLGSGKDSNDSAQNEENLDRRGLKVKTPTAVASSWGWICCAWESPWTYPGLLPGGLEKMNPGGEEIDSCWASRHSSALMLRPCRASP